MSPERMETFEVSVPELSPRFPPLFRRRLEQIGPGEPADRSLLEEICGSASAVNHFLDKAANIGALIPTAWGEYRVAQASTLERLSRVEHPPLQRFVSWALELETVVDQRVLFVAPWIWRETALNVNDLMPLIPLDREDDVVHGVPPQWDAFHMDIDEIRDWRLLLGDEEVGSFSTPGPIEVALVLRAALAPRWREAAGELERSQDVQVPRKEFDRLFLREAPRGSGTLRTGRGLPGRRRLLAPSSFMDKVTDRAPGEVHRMEEGAR